MGASDNEHDATKQKIQDDIKMPTKIDEYYFARPELLYKNGFS